MARGVGYALPDKICSACAIFRKHCRIFGTLCGFLGVVQLVSYPSALTGTSPTLGEEHHPVCPYAGAG